MLAVDVSPDVTGDIPGPESVDDTDASVAALGEGAVGGADLAAAAAALTGLDEIRAEADALVATGAGADPTVPDDVGMAVATSYADLAAEYDRAVAAGLATIDDSDLRTAAALSWSATRRAAPAERGGLSRARRAPPGGPPVRPGRRARCRHG